MPLSNSRRASKLKVSWSNSMAPLSPARGPALPMISATPAIGLSAKYCAATEALMLLETPNWNSFQP